MKIVLLNNPNSGRGAGAAAATELADRLIAAGHAVTRLAAGPNLDGTALRSTIRAAELLVVAGGDGTLNHALPAIIETSTPFYHFPLGTENLFTREFGMDRRPETLLRAIARNEIRACDAAEVNGRPLALMVSVGFDACVVERVAAQRRGGVTRAAYVRCAVQELLNPRVPRMTVRAGERTLVDNAHGLLVIASSSRQYAARLNPAPNASMSDGLLDVVFFPHRTAVGLARWLMAAAAGVHPNLPGLITAQAASVEVQVDAACPHQIDGEAAGMTDGLSVRALPGALRVLVP